MLEALAAGRFPSPRQVTLVVPSRRHAYSGMVPGLLGGRYAPEDLTFDLAALAARAGARLREAVSTGVDPGKKLVRLGDGSVVEYDVASFAIGAGLAGESLPGVREHGLFLKPIERTLGLVTAVERTVAGVRGRAPELVVVGAGAAGIEIALNLRARLRLLGHPQDRITLVDCETRLLRDRSPAAARQAHAALVRQGVTPRLGVEVRGLAPGEVLLADGATVRADLTIWATGAAAPSLFRDSGLATDPSGFLLVEPTLRSVSHASVFAAGDGATIASHPETPRSGVYAVRAGPVLWRNLASAMAPGGGGLRPYRPRPRSLALLNTGDGRAILSYDPIAITAGWAMALKDRIDRRFMERFGTRASCSRKAR